MFDMGWEFVNSPENGQGVRLLSNVITWALILGGWYVVNQQNNARELRKELRAAIDRLITFAVEVSNESLNYHTSSTPVSSSEQKIVADFKRLNRLIQRLPFSHHEKRSIFFHVLLFKKAVTLHNFGSSDFSQQAHNSPLIGEIEHSLENLLDDVERCFHTKFT